MSSITFSHVYKQYAESGTVAVRDFCCEIFDGEFVVVVGASGCGKTTLLRLIAGLESVTSGRILLGGEDLAGKKAGERGVAMVFQRYSLLPHYNVYKNLALGLVSQGISKSEIDVRVRAAAQMLGLSDYLARKPSTLSGGQRQRVALGRAVVMRPKVFLLDEPLSNLDAALRTEMRSEITRLHAQLGTTFLYVTHDQTEAMTMADRILIMNDGKLEQLATPKQIYTHPATKFAATFIGTPKINLIEDKEIIQTLTDNPQTKTIAIRPEDISLQKNPTEPQIELSATITQIEHLGSETIIYCKPTNPLQSNQEPAATTLAIKTPPNYTLTKTQPIKIHLTKTKLHHFNDQGQAIQK